MPQALIEVRALSKDYRTPAGVQPTLREVSLDVAAGDFAAIMGPSGSGKSTLMNLLGCLDRPTRGSLRIAGEDVARLSDEQLAAVRNRTIGFVFQSFNLLPRMSLLDNVALPLVYARVPQAQRQERAREVLSQLGLAAHLHKRPAAISGGQQQRVAIARALVTRPQLLLADEPTGNLDSATSIEVMELLTRLNDGGLTIVLVTHEPDMAAYARRVVHVLDGRIVSDEPVLQRTGLRQAAA